MKRILLIALALAALVLVPAGIALAERGGGEYGGRARGRSEGYAYLPERGGRSADIEHGGRGFDRRSITSPRYMPAPTSRELQRARRVAPRVRVTTPLFGRELRTSSSTGGFGPRVALHDDRGLTDNLTHHEALALDRLDSEFAPRFSDLDDRIEAVDDEETARVGAPGLPNPVELPLLELRRLEPIQEERNLDFEPNQEFEQTFPGMGF